MAATSRSFPGATSRPTHAPSPSTTLNTRCSLPRAGIPPHSSNLSSLSTLRFLPILKTNSSGKLCSRSGNSRPRTVTVAATSAFDVEEDLDLQGESIAEDYYSVLGLKPWATQEEIKSAYYSCMKSCHPDLSNNHPDSVAFCAFVNEIYEVLSDPEMRAVYDEIKGYSVSAINPFFDTEAEREFAFVDEFTCIGCKNCANTAESTFGIEDLFGRARVFNQTGDCPSKVQEAIDTCPVECIHWVSAAQLALLEDEMRRIERVSVGVMMAGQGSKGVDVFRQANSRWERRRRAAEEKARIRAMKEKKRQEAREASWAWDGPWWGGENTQKEEKANEESTESEQERRDKQRRRPSKERMAKAAEAARKWREYSQQGVDRRRRVMALAERKWEEGDEVTIGGSISDKEGPEGSVMGPEGVQGPINHHRDMDSGEPALRGDKELSGAGKA